MKKNELFEKYKKYVCVNCVNQNKDCCDIRITIDGNARCSNYIRTERNKK